MQRATSEAHLISALINTQTVDDAAAYGITPDMLVTHQQEFRWAQSHTKIYGTEPSAEALHSRFPEFPLTTATDVAFFCDEVRQDHTKRTFVRVIKDAAYKVQQGDLEEALIAWSSFSPPNAGTRLVSNYGDEKFLEGYGEAKEALSMPWQTVQNLTGGIRSGDYWTWAARTSQGKSWYLMEIAAHTLMQGYDVMMYSLEMSERQCLIRLHVLLGKKLGIEVDHIEMRDGFYPRRSYERLLGEIRERVPGRFYVHDTNKAKVTPGLLNANAKKVDLSLVDYIGLMSNMQGDPAIRDWRIAAEISNNIKEIAQSQDARIIVASQINRDGENNSWKPPRVGQLSQSDAIGQDSDVVVTMKQYSRSSMVASVEKNRHGAAGIYFWTRFLPNTGDLSEIPRATADAIQAREDDQ